jgi:hypothetical protein
MTTGTRLLHEPTVQQKIDQLKAERDRIISRYGCKTIEEYLSWKGLVPPQTNTCTDLMLWVNPQLEWSNWGSGAWVVENMGFYC